MRRPRRELTTRPLPGSETPMKDAAHSIGQEIRGIAIFLGVVWGMFILNWIVFVVDFNSFGLVPRTFWGYHRHCVDAFPARQLGSSAV